VVTLDPALEDRIRAGFDHNEHGLFLRMSPQAVEATCRLIAAEVEKLTLRGRPPVVLVSPPIRAALKQMTAPHIPQLVVLSYNEITRDTKIESVAMITDGGLRS
jgi:flagellar biosynthesis protein FlhA